jgi:DNA-binding Lrp family transcriptional regulator
MTTTAYTLIEVIPGSSADVLPKLKSLAGVRCADCVTGPYDIIATIEGENVADIGDLITSQIDRIDGVCRTVTCLALT